MVNEEAHERFLTQQAFEALGPGYVLQALASEEDLVQLLDETPQLPALLLLAVSRPDEFDSLVRLRSQRAYDCLPIIVLTGSDTDSDRQRAIELGANEYVVKPTSGPAMSQLVTQLNENWLMK